MPEQPHLVQLQLQKPFWYTQFIPAEGVCSFTGGFVSFNYQQQTHSAIARARITVTGYNFPTARGTPAAGQHAVIQHPPMAHTNIFFFSPLNESPQAQAMPWGNRGGNRHCFKQLSKPCAIFKSQAKCVEKGEQMDSFVLDLFIIFQMGGERRRHREKISLLLSKLSISLLSVPPSKSQCSRTSTLKQQ